MVCVGANILLRHKGLKDRPFLVLNKQTLQMAPEESQIVSKGESHERLDWSSIELSESAGTIRSMEASPLAYDGKYIYAISTKRDRGSPKVILSFALEVYELENGGALKRVRSENLLQNNMILQTLPQVTKKHSLQTAGGVLDHAQLACNGDVLALHFVNETFFFNVKDGRQLSQVSFDDTSCQLVYDPTKHRMMTFQTMCLGSKQSILSLGNFSKPKYALIKSSVPPVVCDKAKAKILAEIEEDKK